MKTKIEGEGLGSSNSSSKANKSFAFGSMLLSLSPSLILCLLGIFAHPSVCAIDSNTAERRTPPSSSVRHGVPSEDPDAYDYLIIQYRGTVPDDSSYSLTKRIVKDGRTPLKKVVRDPLPIRDHDETTKCPHVDNLLPGTAYIQTAPDFFCDANVLAEELLRDGGGSGSGGGRSKRKKKGIKIVHLVGNPFRLAVDNYNYHSRDPTPEAWVKGFDVCASEEVAPTDADENRPERLMSALGSNGVVTDEDFDSVLELCRSLFTTYPGLEEPDYYAHLRKMKPARGLELATSELLRGKRGGDIARMANNVLKLQHLQEMEAQASIAQHRLRPEKRIQVLTLAVEDFDEEPEETAMRFIDFLLGDGTPREVKESIVKEYGEEHLESTNISDDRNRTASKDSDDAKLEASLRGHDLFGMILENIEEVVDYALSDSKRR